MGGLLSALGGAAGGYASSKNSQNNGGSGSSILQKAGRKLFGAGQQAAQDPGAAVGLADPEVADVYGGRKHKGGKIRKTGIYKLEKGEHVLTAKQARKLKERKSSRKSGRR